METIGAFYIIMKLRKLSQFPSLPPLLQLSTRISPSLSRHCFQSVGRSVGPCRRVSFFLFFKAECCRWQDEMKYKRGSAFNEEAGNSELLIIWWTCIRFVWGLIKKKKKEKKRGKKSPNADHTRKVTETRSTRFQSAPFFPYCLTRQGSRRETDNRIQISPRNRVSQMISRGCLRGGTSLSFSKNTSGCQWRQATEETGCYLCIYLFIFITKYQSPSRFEV